MTALSDLLKEVGQPVDADEASDTHRTSVGVFDFRLRRDCHGMLRKLELTFPAALREDVRKQVAVDGWLTISPGELDLLDVAKVGKLYLLSNRLSITFRMNVDREAIAELIRRCVGDGSSTDSGEGGEHLHPSDARR